MKYRILIFITFLFLGAMLSAAPAENGYLALGQGSQSIQIKAIKVTGTDEQRTFEGNVKVVQGNIKLSCDKLTVSYDHKKGQSQIRNQDKRLTREKLVDDDIKSITALGNVKIVQNERMATAGKAFFDSVNRIITLTDSPRIWQGRDAGIAQAIVMYLDENRWEFQGDDSNPIKFTIHPSELKNGKNKESAKKK